MAFSRVGWYPTVLCIAWFLQIYGAASAAPQAALRPVLIAIALCVALTALMTRALGLERGTFAAALLIVALLVVNEPYQAVPFLALILILALERPWVRLGRRALPWRRIHEALGVLVSILLVIQVVRLGMMSDGPQRLEGVNWAAEVQVTGRPPDIILVLADAHGREDILRSHYDYDAGPFLGALAQTGFEIAAASRSNFVATEFSLASMLTGTHLLPTHAMDREALQSYIRTAIHDNPTFPALRRAGYEVSVISGGYEHFDLRSADRFIDTGQPNEFELIMKQNVGSAVLADQLLPGIRIGSAMRDRTPAALDALIRLVDEPTARPRFVLAHLPAPHWPYVFDVDCGPVYVAYSGPHGATPEEIAAYRDQVACVDSMIERSIRQVVERHPSAVVVVFSDHGPEGYLDWGDPGPAGLDERSAILFAARTPGRPDLFPEDITLVNMLPILLHTYLGTDLRLQPNDVWFGANPVGPPFVRVDQRTWTLETDS